MHLIMTIKNIYGLWVAMLTIFYIISKLHKEVCDDNHRGTYKSDMLVNASYIMTIKNILWFWGGDFQDNLQIV